MPYQTNYMPIRHITVFMEEYCENCKKKTEHTQEISLTIPEFVGKYQYPFDVEEAIMCSVCENITKKTEKQAVSK